MESETSGLRPQTRRRSQVGRRSPFKSMPSGKVVEGAGAKYASMPEFKSLVAEHARFHVAAADVIDKADTSSSIDPDQALGPGSEYGIASRNVVQAIIDVRRKSAAA